MKILLQSLAKRAAFASSCSKSRGGVLNHNDFPSFLLQQFSRRIHSASDPDQQFSRRRNSASDPDPPTFGIAFDIDGVLLRGEVPIGGSPQALKSLYRESGALKVPYVFLTNGGGVPESKRAQDLTEKLGVKISPLQVIQGHTPFKELVKRFENELVVAVGKGEPAEVMSQYGFRNVVSIDEYAASFENIDPLSHYKTWMKPGQRRVTSTHSCDQRVHAVFVVSDSIDWSRDIQVLCDILRTGGLPGGEISHQPPLFFASDDLAYQASFPAERLGMGAFRIALEAVFNRIHPKKLEYEAYGKPNPFVFKNAENVLMKVRQSAYGNHLVRPLETLYMIGDNPSVDIKGARQAGDHWSPILTRTGVFQGKENHADYPADMVFDNVKEAVDYIFEKECVCHRLRDLCVC